MFDKEQWLIMGDSEAREYFGVVSNTVSVAPRRGKPYLTYIRVPSGFFSFMRDVLKITVESAKLHPVRFFLEEEGDGWFLCIEYGEVPTVFDLWKYKSVPGWAQFKK